MGNKISKVDIADLDIVDQVELRSDGSTTIIAGVTVVSTTNGTRDVVLSGVDLEDTVNNDDERIQSGDPVTLAGTTGGADGDYTVELILSATSFRVVETISTSTGGTAEFFHPVGASLVGLDSSGLAQTSADNVQGAIQDLDGAISAGGLTEVAHKALRQLIHFIDNGPAEGFASGAFAVQSPATAFPTSKIWYVVGSTPPAGKIVEQTVTYNANKTINTSEWKMYDVDGSTVLVTVTDTFAYSGVFSTGETRAIV